MLDLCTQKYFATTAAPRASDLATSEHCEVSNYVANRTDLRDVIALRRARRRGALLLRYLTPMMRAFLLATLTMRLFGPGTAIRRFRELKRRQPPLDPGHSQQRLEDAMDAFRQLRPWLYTANNHCLLDSLVAAHYLLRVHCVPRLIVGVRTHPFRAHAWVQSGDIVVDDVVERIQLFTPIMTI